MYYDLTRKTLVISAGTLLGLAFFVGWFALDEPEPDLTNSDQKWAVPVMKKKNVEGALKTLTQKNILGKKEAVFLKEVQKLEKPKNTWNLLGFVSEKEGFLALVFDVDKGQTLKLKVGDALPDGQKVFNVQKDMFTYGHDAKDQHQKAFYTYKEGEVLADAAADGLESQEETNLPVMKHPAPQRPMMRPTPPMPTDTLPKGPPTDEYDDDEEDDDL